jgi:hypothetical protein
MPCYRRRLLLGYCIACGTDLTLLAKKQLGTLYDWRIERNLSEALSHGTQSFAEGMDTDENTPSLHIQCRAASADCYCCTQSTQYTSLPPSSRLTSPCISVSNPENAALKSRANFR